MNTEKFADFLRQRRKELGLTQEQLAQLKSVIRSLDKLENIRSFADLL